MRLSAEIRYDATPEAVFAMLLDPGFHERVCLANGSLTHDVRIERHDGGAATITTTRTLPTESVPDFVRGLVGSTLQVTQVDHWEAAGPDGARQGRITVGIEGLPVRLAGTLRLAATSPVTVQTIDGDLRASVPLLGGRVERAVEPAIRSAIRVEQRTSTEWLT